MKKEPGSITDYSSSVTLNIEVSENDTTFITFDGGGKAQVVAINREEVVVKGDNPLPTYLEQYEEPLENEMGWKVVLPRDDKNIWEPFIRHIQAYSR